MVKVKLEPTVVEEYKKINVPINVKSLLHSLISYITDRKDNFSEDELKKLLLKKFKFEREADLLVVIRKGDFIIQEINRHLKKFEEEFYDRVALRTMKKDYVVGEVDKKEKEYFEELEKNLEAFNPYNFL